jgi:cyclopropane fatty-acyl-phospholipid synthase-like methyltransferase
MSNIPDRNTFVNAYAGKAAWDIGRPQKSLVEAADEITGSVLDSGCGTGENALFFAGRGHKVTGIDFLDLPIASAKKKANQRGLRAIFLVWDALELDAFPDQFDSIIDCGLFHVFSDEDRKKYVQGLSSIAKSGSKLFLMCFSDEEPGTQGPRRISQQELRQAFSTNWTVESIQPTRFEVIPDLPDLKFSDGGPKAWFVIVRKI